MIQIGTVKSITIFPIKSCSGILVEKAIATKIGFAHVENPLVSDRKWMVIDANGSFITQRQIPKMALIKPKVDGDNLILTADGMSDLVVPIKAPSNKRKCRVWQTHLYGYSYGGLISKWLSDYLGKENLDLINFGDDQEAIKTANLSDSKEAMNAKESDQILYADYSPYMMLSEESINDLNNHLLNKITVSFRNFRPNILITDCSAFEEDCWRSFKIRDVNFHNVKHCTRCLLTTVNPNTGVKDSNQEPLATLKSYRQNKERYGVSPMFGINVGTDEIGENNVIHLNDPIYSLNE